MTEAIAVQQLQTPKDNVFDPDMWRALAPDLTISDSLDDNYAFPLESPKETRDHLIYEGYHHFKQPGLKIPITAMTKLFDSLDEMELPPVFCILYDETWKLAREIHNAVHCAFDHDYVILPHFWSWRIKPGESGWKGHRDRMAGALFPDKTPKSLTAWIPITPAQPINSCMYALPAHRDKAYVGEGKRELHMALPDIRALPAEAGDVFIWTHSMYHWGSAAAPEHDLPPRMSISFEFLRKDVETKNLNDFPLINNQYLPPFEERLALVAKQIFAFTHMYGFSEQLMTLAKEIQERYELPKSCDIAE